MGTHALGAVENQQLRSVPRPSCFRRRTEALFQNRTRMSGIIPPSKTPEAFVLGDGLSSQSVEFDLLQNGLEVPSMHI